MPINCEGQAILAYGAYLEVINPDTRQPLGVAGLTNFEGPQITRGEIDTTRLCSTAKESQMDLKDNGTFTSTMHTLLGSKSQQILVTNLDSPDPLDFILHLPDDGFGRGEVLCAFKARVTGFPISGAQGQVITTNLSLRITGDLDWTFPDATRPHLKWSAHHLEENAADDGSVSGVISVVLKGDIFTGTDGDPMAGITFSGVPAGLTGEAVKVSDSTVYLGFTGQAVSHTENDAGIVSVTFGDMAFTTGPASAIGNTDKQIINIVFE